MPVSTPPPSMERKKGRRGQEEKGRKDEQEWENTIQKKEEAGKTQHLWPPQGQAKSKPYKTWHDNKGSRAVLSPPENIVGSNI